MYILSISWQVAFCPVEFPSLVALGVVEGRGEAEEALGVDGVVVDPVGDRRHRDPALEDVLRVLGQHGEGHEACNW